MKALFLLLTIITGSQSIVDGVKGDNFIDSVNKVIYVRHSHDGQTVSDITFTSGIKGAKIGKLTGEWPDKTVVARAGKDEETWTVKLLDAVRDDDVQKVEGFSPEEWSLIWNDEFNVVKDMDAGAWGRMEGRWSAAKAFEPDNKELVEMDGENMIIRAKYTKDKNRGNFGYVTGAVRTLTRDSLLLKAFNLCRDGVESRVDIRARYTVGQGNRMALWMLPYPDMKNPLGGEIDIMEHPSHVRAGDVYERNYTTFHTIHHAYSSVNKKSGYHNWQTFTPEEEKEYHVYTVMVLENRYINMYVDGKLVFQYDKNILADCGCPENEWWPFDKYDYYILMTSQTAGRFNSSWDGAPSGPYNDVHMDVDYVRYYRKK